MSILASSPGWNENGPMESQIWLPLMSVPTTGSSGESNSMMPSIMSVYL